MKNKIIVMGIFAIMFIMVSNATAVPNVTSPENIDKLENTDLNSIIASIAYAVGFILGVITWVPMAMLYLAEFLDTSVLITISFFMLVALFYDLGIEEGSKPLESLISAVVEALVVIFQVILNSGVEAIVNSLTYPFRLADSFKMKALEFLDGNNSYQQATNAI